MYIYLALTFLSYRIIGVFLELFFKSSLKGKHETKLSVDERLVFIDLHD